MVLTNTVQACTCMLNTSMVSTCQIQHCQCSPCTALCACAHNLLLMHRGNTTTKHISVLTHSLCSICDACRWPVQLSCATEILKVRHHVLGAISCLILLHVSSQDKGLGTPSRYIARTISWNACKLLIYYYVLFLQAPHPPAACGSASV